MMKTGCIITRRKGHVWATPILAEDYVTKEISKSTKNTDNKLNKLIDHFAMLNQMNA